MAARPAAHPEPPPGPHELDQMGQLGPPRRRVPRLEQSFRAAGVAALWACLVRSVEVRRPGVGRRRLIGVHCWSGGRRGPTAALARAAGPASNRNACKALPPVAGSAGLSSKACRPVRPSPKRCASPVGYWKAAFARRRLNPGSRFASVGRATCADRAGESMPNEAVCSALPRSPACSRRSAAPPTPTVRCPANAAWRTAASGTIASSPRNCAPPLPWMTTAASIANIPNGPPSRNSYPFGPMHAGTFPSQQGSLDPTFGAQMVFDSVTPQLKPNRPPSEGLQFFGQVQIQGKKCRVTLHRQDGTQIFAQSSRIKASMAAASRRAGVSAPSSRL